jgi:hypothetical protein
VGSQLKAPSAIRRSGLFVVQDVQRQADDRIEADTIQAETAWWTLAARFDYAAAEFQTTPKENLMTTSRDTTMPTWAMLLFPGIGVLLLAGGIFWAVQVNNFLASAQTTPGEIVEIRSHLDREGDRMYQPVLRFRLEGREYRVVDPVSTSWQPEVGARVDVLVDPSNPEKAALASFWRQWLGPIIVLSIGSLFTLVGLLLFAFRRHLKRTGYSSGEISDDDDLP